MAPDETQIASHLSSIPTIDARIVKSLRRHDPKQCYHIAVPDVAVLVNSTAILGLRILRWATTTIPYSSIWCPFGRIQEI